MEPALYEELQRSLESDGPVRVIDCLCERLRSAKDYQNLFYALLLKKRYQLGVSPVPTGPSQDLPPEAHAPYEDAIREAGRLVGDLYLQEGNIPQAWVYFRMLGEPQPVADALAKIEPGENDDVQPLVDIAYYQGVHPQKGFDLILKRMGICNAITTISSQYTALPADVRDYCVRQLVRALYAELVARLRADVERTQGKAPPENTVRDLMAAHPSLFEEEFYHIDISHLGAVVQLSIYLEPGEELDKARELCAYGRRLSPRFRYPGEPPFENQYEDYGKYLDVLAGENVEESLTHFRDKADRADPDNEGTRPAEVIVNLLLRIDRPKEALAVARRHLAGAAGPLMCPTIPELCQKSGDYATLAEVARERDDPVHFLAGLLAARGR